MPGGNRSLLRSAGQDFPKLNCGGKFLGIVEQTDIVPINEFPVSGLTCDFL